MTFQIGWLACSQSNFQTEQTAAEGRGVYSTEKGSVTAVSSTLPVSELENCDHFGSTKK